MPIFAETQTSAAREPVPAGTHVARCYGMIDLGTHTDTFKDGKTKRMRKVRFIFELPDELKVFSEERGLEPHIVGKEFTLTTHEKGNLYAFMTSWAGRPLTKEETEKFDVTRFLGAACLLNIIHEPRQDGKGIYAKIAGVSRLLKNMEAPTQLTPRLEFSLAEFDATVFESLPDYLKDKIKTSEEYIALHPAQVAAPAPAPLSSAAAPAAPTAGNTDNDLPF